MYAFYEPFKFFFLIGSVLILVASAIGLRFLWDYFTDGGAGHVQSLILAGALIVTGAVTWLFGVLADLIGRNRQLSEEILLAHAAARAARRRRTRDAPPPRSAGRRRRPAALARGPPAAMIRAVLFGTYTAAHPANRLLAAALEAAGCAVAVCHEPLWERTRDKTAAFFGARSLARLGLAYLGAAARLRRRFRALPPAGPRRSPGSTGSSTSRSRASSRGGARVSSSRRS